MGEANKASTKYPQIFGWPLNYVCTEWDSKNPGRKKEPEGWESSRDINCCLVGGSLSSGPTKLEEFGKHFRLPTETPERPHLNTKDHTLLGLRKKTKYIHSNKAKNQASTIKMNCRYQLPPRTKLRTLVEDNRIQSLQCIPYNVQYKI